MKKVYLFCSAGMSTSILASVAGILMILVGLVGVRKRKED